MIYYSRDEVERIGRAGSCMRRFDNGKNMAFRYLSSFWLFVEPQDKAFTPHGADGFWESWITKWMSEQFEDADMFIDVGANVGYYTLMAAKAGVKTIAFEPQSRLCTMIRASLDVNKARNAEVVCRALSDKRGEIFLVVPDEHSGGAFLSEKNNPIIDLKFHSERVQIETLDRSVRVVPGRKVVVKIDAEGAEPNIWAGMQDTFAVTDCTVILEWDSSRYDAEAFGKSLFDGYLNYVAIVDYDGKEVERVHWRQLAQLEGLHMVVVRKREQ